jgi:glycerate-2-kinase
MARPIVQREDIEAIVRAGIDAVEPMALVVKALESGSLARADQRYRVLCAGKAAGAMAAGAGRASGPELPVA